MKKGLVIGIIIIAIVALGGYLFLILNSGEVYNDGNFSNCAKEGEEFSVVYGEYSDNCCEGLTEWDSGFDTRISVEDKCYEMGLLGGSPVGTCINCGNGICEDIEDVCNCPEDCPNWENSDYTLESFCEWWWNFSSKEACNSTNMADFNYELCDLCK